MNITEIPKLNNTIYNIQKQHEKDKNCNHVPKVTNHVCSEFEMEVLNECTQRILLLKNKTDRTMYRKKANNTNQFSHRLIRECARDIHNREYWNEKNGSFMKKWQKEKLTCNLMFSNKWVSGFLRRENARRMGSIDNNNDHNNNAIDIHIQSDDQVETMKITASAEVNFAADNGNGNITVSHCDDGNMKVNHCYGGNMKVSHCDDGNDGNVKVSHCDDGDVKVNHCDDGDVKVSHCDDGDVKVSHCDDRDVKVSHCDDVYEKVSHCDDGDDGNVKVSHCDDGNDGDVKVSHCDDGNVEGCDDDGDGGIDCREQVDDNNGPFAPYDDDLLRDIIAFINGKGSL